MARYNKLGSETKLGESVVDDVRAIREAIDEEVGHDLTRLAAEARRVGEAVRREFGMKAAELPAEGGSAAAKHGTSD